MACTARLLEAAASCFKWLEVDQKATQRVERAEQHLELCCRQDDGARQGATNVVRRLWDRVHSGGGWQRGRGVTRQL